jgi:16S rRNA (cytidine1402-2'-O)-methyltransferase
VTLVLVATPIGNLGDLAPRATAVLASADIVCCEDTRRTRALLTAAGIPAGGRLRSLHAHNEAARIPELLAALAAGSTVAVVSDAGTPGVSDPGSRLVAAAVAAGVDVTTVPGPSAALAALVVSGLPTDRFSVEGFLPRRGEERRTRLEALLADDRTTVIFEAPGRVVATLADLAALAPERPVAVCRELTKLHEEVWRSSASEAAAAWGRRAELRGEFVVVVAPSPPPAPAGEDAVAVAVGRALAGGASTRDAADEVVALLGVGRRRAYEEAVRQRAGRSEERGGRP